jgi:hypothetical protein
MNSDIEDKIIYSVDLSPSGELVLRPQKQLTAKRRGRPWPKGTSGNPKGRPRGARNKFTMAVLGAVNTKPMKPGVFLDKNYPHFNRGRFLLQKGRKFNPDTLEAMPGPTPPIPTKFDRRRQVGYDCVHQGRRCIFTADGWLFDRVTGEPIP